MGFIELNKVTIHINQASVVSIHEYRGVISDFREVVDVD